MHFFLARKHKSIMTIVPSNFINMVLCSNPWKSRFCRAFLGSPGPLAARRGGDYIRAVKARRTPPAPQPPVRQTSHPSRHFCPELLHRARGCFLNRVLRLRFCRRKLRPLSIDPRWCVVCLGRNHCPTLLAAAGGCMITAWSVIALSPQDPTFSRPIWSRMAPRLQGGSLLPRQPPTPLRNDMSYPGTFPTRSSISLILN